MPHHTLSHYTTLCHAIKCPAMLWRIASHWCTAHRIKSHLISTYRIVSFLNITHHISTAHTILHHTPHDADAASQHTAHNSKIVLHSTTTPQHHTPQHTTPQHTHICILGVTESSHQSNQSAYIKITKQECQKMSGDGITDKDRIGHDKAEIGHTGV